MKGHTLDLVITFVLSAYISFVMDVAVSDHFCIFFLTVDGFKALNSGLWGNYLTAEVTVNFIELLIDPPVDFLPSSCEFFVNSVHSNLRTILDK